MFKNILLPLKSTKSILDIKKFLLSSPRVNKQRIVFDLQQEFPMFTEMENHVAGRKRIVERGIHLFCMLNRQRT